MVGEFSWQADARKSRQMALYPELEFGNIDSILAVDKVRRQQGQEPTSFGRDLESAYARSGSDLLDDNPDAAPRGAPDRAPRASDILPSPVTWGGPRSDAYPSDGASTSPFRVAEQQRWDEQQGVRDATTSSSAGAGIKESLGFLGGSLGSRLLPDSSPTPLRMAVEEGLRPSNYLGAAFRGLSFVPKAGTATRLAVEGAAAIGGGLAGGALYDATEGLPEGVRGAASLVGSLAGNIGTGAAAGKLARTASQAVGSDLSQRLLADEAGGGNPFSRAAPAVDQTVPETPASKLLGLVQDAKPVLREQQAARAAELRRRAGALAGSLESGRGEGAFIRAKGALKGELPSMAFEALRPKLEPDDVTQLFEQVRTSDLRPFEKLNVSDALVKTLAGELPTRGEIAGMERIFGADLAQALLKRRSFGAKAWENFVDVANVPRALQSSIDLSAPMRQGIMLGSGHPVEGFKAIKPMLRAFASPRAAADVEASITARPWAELADRANLYRAPVSGVTTALSDREEAFMSNLVSRIPGINASGRAYATYLNKLRDDVFGGIVSKWDEAHVTDANLQRLGSFLNAATGRGNVAALQSITPALNAAFFSPRYFVSRLQSTAMGAGAAVDLGKSALTGAEFNPVSKEIARDLAAFYGTGVAVLGLLKASGAVDVEMDPRSTDFGKAKVGPVRYDFWAGQQQIARYMAQFVSGERKSTSSGNVLPANRAITVGRFLQSKLSPSVGFGVDLLRGETMMGEDIQATPDSLARQLGNRLGPLFLLNLKEAVDEMGLLGGIAALPAGIGMGVQVYGGIQNQFDRQARDQFGKSYNEVSPSERQALLDANPGLVEQQSRERLKAGGVSGRAEELKQKTNREQTISDQRYQTGEISATQWRDDLGTRQLELRARRDELMHEFQGDGKASDLLSKYFAAIDDSKRGDGTVDWDQVDSWRGNLSPGDDKFIDDNTGLGGTPLVREYRQLRREMDAAGYYDLRDKAWAELQKLHPEQLGSLPNDFYKWRAQEIADLTEEGVAYGYPREIARELAADKVATYKTVTGFNEFYRTEYRHQWVADHPDEAQGAWGFGLFDPDKSEKAFLSKRALPELLPAGATP